jgi:Na+/H+ antiporter NhaB
MFSDFMSEFIAVVISISIHFYPMFHGHGEAPSATTCAETLNVKKSCVKKRGRGKNEKWLANEWNVG